MANKEPPKKLSDLEWETLMRYERNTNYMVVRATCDSIRRNISDVLELLTHLEQMFPQFNKPKKED